MFRQHGKLGPRPGASFGISNSDVVALLYCTALQVLRVKLSCKKKAFCTRSLPVATAFPPSTLAPTSRLRVQYHPLDPHCERICLREHIYIIWMNINKNYTENISKTKHANLYLSKSLDFPGSGAMHSKSTREKEKCWYSCQKLDLTVVVNGTSPSFIG